MLRKILKKKIFISICAIIGVAGGCLLLFSGCGQSGESKDYKESADAYYNEDAGGASDSMEAGEISEEAAADADTGGEMASGTDDVSGAEQRMITTWYFTMESSDYEASISKIDETVRSLNGYVEAQNEFNENDDLRSASYVIRIPDEEENDWLTQVEDMGTITSKSKNLENVTLQYIDTESRLNSLKTEREVLTRLLGSSEKVEDIIKVQSELTDVNYQIESYESQIRSMENDINYMTVNLEITEVKRETNKGTGIMDEISNRFANAADGIAASVRFVFVNILGYSLYIILAALAAVIVWKVYRKRMKKHHEEKEKNSGLGREDH